MAVSRMKSIAQRNETELKLGVSASASWHAEFAHSPYIHIGSIPYELTEGDIVVVFSQYGVVDALKLGRDKETRKPRGYCFLRYEDPRSAVLAVDNLNGADIAGRRITVNHVKEYKNPEDMDIVSLDSGNDSLLDEDMDSLDDSGVQNMSSEELQLYKDKKRKKKEKQLKREAKEEKKSIELMKAAMTQDKEEQKRILEKARRRQERKANEDLSRDQAEPSKRIKTKEEDYEEIHYKSR